MAGSFSPLSDYLTRVYNTQSIQPFLNEDSKNFLRGKITPSPVQIPAYLDPPPPPPVTAGAVVAAAVLASPEKVGRREFGRRGFLAGLAQLLK